MPKPPDKCHLDYPDCNCTDAPYGFCNCGCGRPVGKQGCTGHARNRKKLCDMAARRGKCTCRIHGGNKGHFKSGPLNPAWKHGIYSTSVPARYAETATRALNHPDFWTNRQQIGLMEGRAAELFEQLSRGESGQLYASAKKLLAQLVFFLEKGDLKKAIVQCEQILQVLEQGSADALIWNDLLVLWAERRKALDVDSKVQFRQRVAMSQEQAAALAAIVIQAAFEEIPSDEGRQRFADRVEANSPGGVRALVAASSA